MSKFITVTSVQHIAGEHKQLESIVNIASIAIVNKIVNDPNSINSEIRIHGGGTIRCAEAYESIKFLIGIEGGLSG